MKTTKDRVAGEPSKKCKYCAESEKLAAQRRRLASHLEEEERTMYGNLASFPSLARWRKALDDKVATKCNARSGHLISPFSVAKWRR